MFSVNDYFKFGISVALLYPEAFQDQYRHLAAFAKTARLNGFDALEAFLPDDDRIRQTEIAILRDEGKSLNYNLPGDLQLDGAYNPGSLNPEYRQNAIDLAKRHLDYAAEAGCKIVAVTSGPDLPEKRVQILAYFCEFMTELADYAQQYEMMLVLEPVERGRFKNLLLGPTKETVDCVLSLKNKGKSNVKMLVDTAHIPLMGENQMDALTLSLQAGIGHVHLGNSVIRNPQSKFYGHFHPPIGVHDGEYDLDDVSRFLAGLIECGYIPRKPGQVRSSVSVEMAPYPGVSPETSARVAHEKISNALQSALAS